MNFLNRKMFQAGGGAVALGDFDIRDKRTGQVTTVRPDFINTPGFNPYKILYDDTLEKGPAVMSILQQFKERDAPQLGPFQAKEDVGTNIADLGFGVARATEPFVRGASRLVGEVTGIQPLKEFGGKQKFDPSLSMFGGIDLFKPTYESYVPTDEDRARAMLRLVKQKDAPTQPVIAGDEESTFDFRDEDIRSKVSQSEYDEFQELIGPTFNPFTDPITPMLDELQQERLDLEERFAEENIQRPPTPETPPPGLGEIDDLLEQITPAEMQIDINKTIEDSMLDVEKKFDAEDIKPDLLRVDTSVISEEEAQEYNKKQPPVVPKETTGLFGSDRFLDFIRNVGAGLVASGQMGEGLATGAAKAAEERTARELLESQERKKFEDAKRLLEIEAGLEGQAGMDYKEAKSLGEAEEAVITNLTNFQKSERTLKDLDDVFKDLEDPNAYGVKGWLQESMDKLAAAAGMSTGKWKKLSPTSRINATLKVLQQASVREILGESGKTISNLDRNIVADIFGELTVFTDEAIIKDKLTRTRATVLNSMEADQGQLIKNLSYFARTGATSPLVTRRQSLIDKILDIDLTKLADPMSYLGVSTDQGITDIGLVPDA